MSAMCAGQSMNLPCTILVRNDERVSERHRKRERERRGCLSLKDTAETPSEQVMSRAAYRPSQTLESFPHTHMKTVPSGQTDRQKKSH